MDIVGENKQHQVVSGVFYLADTIGLPLDIIVEYLRENEVTPAWDFYVKEAREAGWKDKTIRNKLLQIDLPENLIDALL